MNILRLFLRLLKRINSSLIRFFIPIKKGRVLCESFGGLQYSCNPKYIAEFLLDNYPNEYEVVFAFDNPYSYNFIDTRIKKVRKSSFKELFYINTSEYIISNNRLNDYGWGWRKRKGQKYIMTWHGSMALKRVEFDAADHLSSSYLKKAEQDSKNIDLMLSDSAWCTRFYRKAFHFDGDILEKGLPRNDIFFHLNKIKNIRSKVRQYYKIANNKKVLLYAPTFRVDKRLDNYISQWDEILAALKDRFNEEFVVLFRLHPNMMKTISPQTLLTHRDMIDVTQYGDMQELLCVADVMMTDYSSSMFEVALMYKPCFLYVPDVETYDRGFYFHLNSLPFPVSRNIEQMTKMIQSFDESSYKIGVHKMFDKTFNYIQNGYSCTHLVHWMKEHAIE